MPVIERQRRIILFDQSGSRKRSFGFGEEKALQFFKCRIPRKILIGQGHVIAY